MKTLTAGIALGGVDAPFRLVLGDIIGPDECPYVQRWFVQTPLGTARVHHFMRSDDDRALHDHPWSFVTLVVRGSYRDITACPWCADGKVRIQRWPEPEAGPECGPCLGTGVRVDELTPGSVRYRPAEHQHRVESDGAWTIVLSGRKRRTWGFWEGAKFTRWREYLALNGLPACADLLPRGRRREP